MCSNVHTVVQPEQKLKNCAGQVAYPAFLKKKLNVIKALRARVGHKNGKQCNVFQNL